MQNGQLLKVTKMLASQHELNRKQKWAAVEDGDHNASITTQIKKKKKKKKTEKRVGTTPGPLSP